MYKTRSMKTSGSGDILCRLNDAQTPQVPAFSLKSCVVSKGIVCSRCSNKTELSIRVLPVFGTVSIARGTFLNELCIHSNNEANTHHRMLSSSGFGIPVSKNRFCRTRMPPSVSVTEITGYPVSNEVINYM